MSLYWNNSGVVGLNGSAYVGNWIPPDISGLTYTIRRIQPDEVGRLDLVSFRVYGDEQYFWVLAHFNCIIDVFNGFSANDTLMIPALNSYLERWQAVNPRR